MNLEHKTLRCTSRKTRELASLKQTSRRPNQFRALIYVASMSMTLICICSFKMHKDLKVLMEKQTPKHPLP